MLTRTSTAAIAAAFAIGLSGAVVPAATAVPSIPVISASDSTGVRPSTVILDGNRTVGCEVDWFADAVLDRRFDDWTNNGFIHKVKSPHQADAPVEASAPGSMELQHYFTPDDTLYLRVPVGTDEDMSNARFVIDLPQIEGYEWQMAPTFRPFYPVGATPSSIPCPSVRLRVVRQCTRSGSSRLEPLSRPWSP